MCLFPCSGNYEGPEPQRLATLKYAAMRGAPHVDVEFKAAQVFFASKQTRILSWRQLTSGTLLGACL